MQLAAVGLVCIYVTHCPKLTKEMLPHKAKDPYALDLEAWPKQGRFSLCHTRLDRGMLHLL